MDQKPVNCLKCKYFYVTWDSKHPRGCRLYGFKTQLMPSLLVFQSTGAPCPSYAEKEGNEN